MSTRSCSRSRMENAMRTIASYSLAVLIGLPLLALGCGGEVSGAGDGTSAATAGVRSNSLTFALIDNSASEYLAWLHPMEESMRTLCFRILAPPS